MNVYFRSMSWRKFRSRIPKACFSSTAVIHVLCFSLFQQNINKSFEIAILANGTAQKVCADNNIIWRIQHYTPLLVGGRKRNLREQKQKMWLAHCNNHKDKTPAQILCCTYLEIASKGSLEDSSAFTSTSAAFNFRQSAKAESMQP